MCGIQRDHGLAVAQDRHGVGNRDDLFQLVRDHDARHALLFQIAQQAQQVFAVILVQRRSRLVQDQQLDVLAQRLGDLDQLLLADAQILDLGGGVDAELDLLQHLVGLLDGLVPVDQEALPDLVAEENVLVDRQLGEKRQLLIDDGDADLFAVGDALEFLNLAAEQDVAVIAAVRPDPAQHLHQGGLACAVLADQAVDLTLGDAKADIVQGLHTGKCLGDGFHL